MEELKEKRNQINAKVISFIKMHTCKDDNQDSLDQVQEKILATQEIINEMKEKLQDKYVNNEIEYYKRYEKAKIEAVELNRKIIDGVLDK